MYALHIRDFPKQLAQEARVRSAREGISMKDLILRAVRNELKRVEQKETITKP